MPPPLLRRRRRPRWAAKHQQRLSRKGRLVRGGPFSSLLKRTPQKIKSRREVDNISTIFAYPDAEPDRADQRVGMKADARPLPEISRRRIVLCIPDIRCPVGDGKINRFHGLHEIFHEERTLRRFMHITLAYRHWHIHSRGGKRAIRINNSILRIEDSLQLASGSFNSGVAQLSHLAAGIINIPAVFGLLSGHFLLYNKNRERRSPAGNGKRNREEKLQQIP